MRHLLLLGLALTVACGVQSSDDLDGTDDDTDSDADADTDSDSDSDADTDSDSVPMQTLEEQYWDDAGQCWAVRDIVRPAAEWGVVWDPNACVLDDCCDVLAAYSCVDPDTGEIVYTDDCFPDFLPYSSADGLCTRWYNDQVNGGECPITDPWVKPCEDVEGCCDLTRANAKGAECD